MYVFILCARKYTFACSFLRFDIGIFSCVSTRSRPAEALPCRTSCTFWAAALCRANGVHARVKTLSKGFLPVVAKGPMQPKNYMNRRQRQITNYVTREHCVDVRTPDPCSQSHHLSDERPRVTTTTKKTRGRQSRLPHKQVHYLAARTTTENDPPPPAFPKNENCVLELLCYDALRIPTSQAEIVKTLSSVLKVSKSGLQKGKGVRTRQPLQHWPIAANRADASGDERRRIRTSIQRVVSHAKIIQISTAAFSHCAADEIALLT